MRRTTLGALNGPPQSSQGRERKKSLGARASTGGRHSMSTSKRYVYRTTFSVFQYLYPNFLENSAILKMNISHSPREFCNETWIKIPCYKVLRSTRKLDVINILIVKVVFTS